MCIIIVCIMLGMLGRFLVFRWEKKKSNMLEKKHELPDPVDSPPELPDPVDSPPELPDPVDSPPELPDPVDSLFIPFWRVWSPEDRARHVLIESRDHLSNVKRVLGTDLDEYHRDNFNCRLEYITKFGHTILCPSILKEVVKLTKGNILGLGVGTAAIEAYLAGILDQGRQLFPTDIKPLPNSHMPVEGLENSAAVATLGEQCDTVIFCWPDLKDPSTCIALQVRPTPFPFVVYVGEREGGCTGDITLHRYLEIYYEQIYCSEPEQWYGIYDCVIVYRLKKKEI